jgi:hypothetical protein
MKPLHPLPELHVLLQRRHVPCTTDVSDPAVVLESSADQPCCTSSGGTARQASGRARTEHYEPTMTMVDTSNIAGNSLSSFCGSADQHQSGSVRANHNQCILSAYPRVVRSRIPSPPNSRGAPPATTRPCFVHHLPCRIPSTRKPDEACQSHDRSTATLQRLSRHG